MIDPHARPSESPSDAPEAKHLRRSDLEALQADLAAGAECQKSLLPEPPFMAGYDFGVFYRGAKQVSGDFYDFLSLSGGMLGIAIADASGKGVAAAMQTMVCRAFLHTQAESGAGPGRVLANVNRLISGQLKKGSFISAVYALLNSTNHTLLVGNAGHLPLVVWRAKLKVATIHPSKGPVLGVVPALAYEKAITEETVQLDVGDRFVLITDGVNEAMAPGQREFGMEHLRRRLKSDSDGRSFEFLKSIVDQIEIHRGGGEQSDDITILTGRRLR